jgi:hypothetical protein
LETVIETLNPSTSTPSSKLCSKAADRGQQAESWESEGFKVDEMLQNISSK